MSEFKVGDRVVCKSTIDYLVAGNVYVVEKYIAGYTKDFITLVGYDGLEYYTSRFDLYEEKQEMKSNVEQFDMKTQPWYIRVNNEEEFNLTEEWLLENDGRCLDVEYDSRVIKYITNCMRKENVEDFLMFGNNIENKMNHAKEIKMNFKTIIDSVAFPAVESEKDKQIRELQNTIELAQKQINRLKEMK